MLRRASELEVKENPNLRGGEKTTVMRHLLSPDEAMNKGRLFALTVIPPGGSIGYHQHVGDFEIYYITKGKAKINDNGREDEMGPGDMLLCNDGDWHSIENVGDGDLEFLAVVLYS